MKFVNVWKQHKINIDEGGFSKMNKRNIDNMYADLYLETNVENEKNEMQLIHQCWWGMKYDIHRSLCSNTLTTWSFIIQQVQDGLHIHLFSEKQVLHAVSQVAIGAMQRGWRQISTKMQIKEIMKNENGCYRWSLRFVFLPGDIECLQIRQNEFQWKIIINTENAQISTIHL